MLKRLHIICLTLAIFCFTAQSFAQRGKSEIAFGYGYWSIYSLANGTPFNTSSGVYNLTYRYYLSKDVSLGLAVGSENIKSYGSFTTIVPELTVKYLDTRHSQIRVRLYGAVSYGVTIFQDHNVLPNQADNSGLWAYGFQATPFGIRIGRQVAFFTEIGLGYKGLVHCGVNLRVPRVLAVHRHTEE